MGKYLKKFENHSDYETYINGSDVALPNVSLCKQLNEVHYNPKTWADEYLTFVAKESGTFTFEPKNSNVISYSTDNGETWTQGNSVAVSSGGKVMWKGTMTSSSVNGIGNFGSTANFDVQGNVMSLLYGDNYKGKTDLPENIYLFSNLFKNNTKVVNAGNLSLPATTLTRWCYYYMFYGCTNLKTAPVLPATTLAYGCYMYMFVKCTSLETTPQLPATTLTDYCYWLMFQGCTSLTIAPELPAQTLTDHCYNLMFQGCTSLTTAPELPAQILASDCYGGMFSGCTSLTTAPELPATTLAYSCYSSMFLDCTSLVTAPELPATTLVGYCYKSMFQGCTSLVNAPALPATTLVSKCYDYMFQGCTSLNYIKAMFTTTPSLSYTDKWVNGVSATGTFVKNSAATWTTTGNNGIPTGWTVQTEGELSNYTTA